MQQINFKIFWAIFLTLLVPTLYTTFRIYLIGDIPNEWGYNIASQIAWLNIAYEILQEAIILPLFFVLGASGNLHKKVKQLLLVIFPLYIVASCVLWFSASGVVTFLNQSPNLIAETVEYIRWESVAIPFRVIVDIIFIALITMAAKRKIYIFLVVQLVVRVVCDFVFLNQFSLGVLGIAYSTVCINALIACVGMAMLFRNAPKQIDEKTNWMEWLKLSAFAGAESGIRNIVFILMILKLVNEIGEQGTLWLANNFIWHWLLLPVLALGQTIKQDVATSKGIIGKRFNAYLLLTAIFVGVWLLTIPVWQLFLKGAMGIENPSEVFELTLLLLTFYIVFAFNNVFDSYFYGMGRTDLMLLQSLAVNCIYYGAAFILYWQGVFVPTLFSIAMLFGFGIVLDFTITVWLFWLVGYPRRS